MMEATPGRPQTLVCVLSTPEMVEKGSSDELRRVLLQHSPNDPDADHLTEQLRDMLGSLRG